MIIKTINLILAIPLLIICCGRVGIERDYPLYVKNESSHSIMVYFNDDENYKAVFPDTTITDYGNRLSINILSGERKSVAGGGTTWESIFEVSVPFDTLSLFVFHSDTLSKHPWSEIRNDYKILKRYDLSLGDLERLDFKVIYPPDASMVGVKMYPF